MTEYLVFDALKSKKISLKQTLGVSERAWKMPGSRMFIDPKMQVPVEDLIKGMIVQIRQRRYHGAGRGRGRHGRALCAAHE